MSYCSGNHRPPQSLFRILRAFCLRAPGYVVACRCDIRENRCQAPRPLPGNGRLPSLGFRLRVTRPQQAIVRFGGNLMRTITESESTPKADGFFMPAEFAPQDRVWMGWPHRTDTWPMVPSRLRSSMPPSLAPSPSSPRSPCAPTRPTTPTARPPLRKTRTSPLSR